ncbi:MAG: hypothetical protein V4635_03795 [Bacteroidota bacterium]
MNETQLIENYLFDRLSPEDKLLMDARLLVNNELREKILWQNQSYQLVNQHGRKKLREEIEALSTKIFSEQKFSSLRKKIFQIFNKDL